MCGCSDICKVLICFWIPAPTGWPMCACRDICKAPICFWIPAPTGWLVTNVCNVHAGIYARLWYVSEYQLLLVDCWPMCACRDIRKAPICFWIPHPTGWQLTNVCMHISHIPEIYCMQGPKVMNTDCSEAVNILKTLYTEMHVQYFKLRICAAMQEDHHPGSCVHHTYMIHGGHLEGPGVFHLYRN